MLWIVSILLSVLVGVPCFIGNLLYWGRFYKINNLSDKSGPFDSNVAKCQLGTFFGSMLFILCIVPGVNLFLITTLVLVVSFIFGSMFIFQMGGKLENISISFKKEI